ncbi:SRPBCC family protein [Achromobacter xylosoxidans]|uniref:SRPBCC family protein n=1 Tax=Alcaligenes xylosoxydans xylosoxydans TaxID=85698 RepID=UPI002ACADAA8|nr:SRPBCC family protein [Achromobacter xylosoxidans]MDZ5613458.1 SRPBCC family protein [Achromobacter xylosoxidans]MDZ5628862.1 SRPBCC family protein [Achromobacter xylosoxidans]MDZ5687578.1 SRPBCC family protein [Achromobacter xylosoxidans]
MSEYGIVTSPTSLCFTRVLPASVERVWAFLTESDKRGLWLATGDMELREGGGVTLRFVHADLSSVAEPTPEPYRPYENGVTTHGVITRCEPPRLLAFTWGGSPGEPSEVTFELSPQGDDTRLVLTHRKLASRAGMIDVAGGWHTHLGVLSARLAGREPGPFWSALLRWEADYQARIPAQ